MKTPNLDFMKSFDENNIPNLDKAVLAALELFIAKGVPRKPKISFKKPLVVGSGNAASTGRIIFPNGVFADESDYTEILNHNPDIDGVILISASGEKHAPIIAKNVKERKMKLMILTCNKNASSKKYADYFIVSQKNREPYTYNTSTYLGMVIAMTGEDPNIIYKFILNQIDKLVPNFAAYNSFFILVPEEYNQIREMFSIKFSELFGPNIIGRIYTLEQTKHAKTVISSSRELFIGLGVKNEMFGLRRFYVPLPKDCGPAAVISIGYYIIGKIQEQHEAFFKKNIISYCEKASQMFGHPITPIVE